MIGSKQAEDYHCIDDREKDGSEDMLQSTV
jgi:hypothetical protein